MRIRIQRSYDLFCLRILRFSCLTTAKEDLPDLGRFLGCGELPYIIII